MKDKERITKAVQAVSSIGRAAEKTFIDRDELIKAIQLGLISGQHVIIMGPPGTGKSRCIRYFAEAMGIDFFRKLLNPDLPREDIVGPIDPMALQEGRWDRKWLGLATCPVVFIDEIGKGSAQVMNMLLDAMEERKASAGDNDRDIPLHTLFAASNETIMDESPALWNRFSVRVVVRRISELGDFKNLIEKAWGCDTAPKEKVNADDLELLRKTCRKMASNASKNNSLMRGIVKMWREFDNVGSYRPTDRQWLNTLIVAAANALLSGRDVMITSDLRVAAMTLWDDIDEIEDIRAFVEDICNQEDRERATAQEALVRMRKALTNAQGELTTLGTLSYRAKALLEQIEEKVEETGDREWKNLKDEVSGLVQDVENQAMGAVEPTL